MTTLQKSIITLSLIATLGIAIYKTRQESQTRTDMLTLQQQNKKMATQMQDIQQERVKASNRIAALTAEVDRNKSNNLELLRLRGMAGVARRAMSEAEQLRDRLSATTTRSETNLMTGVMADSMQQAMEQQVEGRLSRLKANLQLTEEQTQAARGILVKQSRIMSSGMQQAFSGKFDKAEIARLAREGGNPEEQIKALLTPGQLENYPNAMHDEAAHNAGLAANSDLLQIQTTLDLTPEQKDRAYSALYEVNLNQLTGSATQPHFTNQFEAMKWGLDQKAHALESVLTPAQLENYQQQQAAQARIMKDILNKMDISTPSK